MLSTRHFNKMAEIIANEPTGNHATQQAIHAAFIQLIEAFPNPRFDRQKFNEASKAHEIKEGQIRIEYIPNTQYSGSPYPIQISVAEHPNDFEIYARERFIGREDPEYRESFVWRLHTFHSWEALRDLVDLGIFVIQQAILDDMKRCPECYGTGGLYDSQLGINDECPTCGGE